MESVRCANGQSLQPRDLQAKNEHLPGRKYGQRWAVESAFARHKRLLRSALRGPADSSRQRECYLRVVTHNLLPLAASA
jgi:hypothetical protein